MTLHAHHTVRFVGGPLDDEEHALHDLPAWLWFAEPPDRNELSAWGRPSPVRVRLEPDRWFHRYERDGDTYRHTRTETRVDTFPGDAWLVSHPCPHIIRVPCPEGDP